MSLKFKTQSRVQFTSEIVQNDFILFNAMTITACDMHVICKNMQENLVLGSKIVLIYIINIPKNC